MESDPPGLAALRNALGTLVRECGGMLGAVMDEGNGLWCTAPHKAGSDAAADKFYRREIATRAKSLRRGHRMSIQRNLKAEWYAAESFAAIYVVVVWFAGVFETEEVKRKIREALPKIEALTLAMPPFDGPEGPPVAQKMRA